MEGRSYVSCIKINGVPVLPPMVTNDMRKELFNYKESAINIEKKLAALHIAKKCNANLYVQNFEERPTDIHSTKKVYCLKDTLDPLEYKNNNYIETNVMDLNKIQTETVENSNEAVGNSLQCSMNIKMRDMCGNQASSNNDSVLRAELVTASVNSNDCTHKPSTAVSSITKAVPEIWKPQVPKTLNIIPLTLNNTSCTEDMTFQKSDLYNIRNTPKLVRQGSYVLDAPSPILLAHMKMELASSNCSPCSEYVPTPCINTACKEWNISSSAVEWECETTNKEPVATESSKSFSTYEENSYSNSRKSICKSASLQAKPETHLTMHPSTRSVDCIQTMLTEEHIEANNMHTNRHRGHTSVSANENVRSFQIRERCKNVMLNGTDKTGNSLEDVNEPKNVCIGNYSEEKISKNLKMQGSIMPKMKSSIASDKLLIVYKKVQEMHKKQMAELMSRQHREQTLLQQEFEKQQLLLLTEIRKTFPEFSVALLSENVLSPTFKATTPNCYNEFENVERNLQQNTEGLSTNLQQGNKLTHLQNDNTKIVQRSWSSNDTDINSTNILAYQTLERETTPNKTKVSERSMEKESTDTQSDVSKHYGEKLRNIEGKRANVSRELFPLDSKTVHVPILDKTIYGIKYIKAVNTINAYARGYLVRRLMKTERVIALKNTYKEALHCMLKLHAEEPLNQSEFNFLRRLHLQCDAASMNIVELFAQSPKKRMQVIEQDRESRQSRTERPASARSYSFATQRTLARKKLKEMEEYQPTSFVRSCLSRSRCKTWTSDIKETFVSTNILDHGIKRSTSAGTVRKPWR